MFLCIIENKTKKLLFKFSLLKNMLTPPPPPKKNDFRAVFSPYHA